MLALVVMIGFGIIYALLSIVNHINFHTYGFDLGIYTHALYDYAHFRLADCSLFLYDHRPLLADHFDLYLPLLSPLVWLFGQYTLLIVQIAAVMVGMWGTYRLADSYPHCGSLPIAAMVMVGASFGVWHALAFDYHSNVVAAMLLPWLLLSVRQRKPWGVILVSVAIAISKETSALWMIAVLIGLLWDVRRDRMMLRTVGLTGAGITAYFLCVVIWIMPSLYHESSTGFWRYDWMGGNFGEVALWIVSHPVEAMRDIFISFLPEQDFHLNKREFFICAFTSGMMFALVKPNYLLMTVPPLLIKMLSRDGVCFWGISYQYNVEICMVAVMAAVAVIPKIKSPTWQHTAAVVAMVLTVATLFYTTNKPRSYIAVANTCLLDSRHWHQEKFNKHDATHLIESLPTNAAVSASGELVSHIALRDQAFLYPRGVESEAQYLLLTEEDWPSIPEGWQTIERGNGVALYAKTSAL